MKTVVYIYKTPTHSPVSIPNILSPLFLNRFVTSLATWPLLSTPCRLFYRHCHFRWLNTSPTVNIKCLLLFALYFDTMPLVVAPWRTLSRGPFLCLVVHITVSLGWFRSSNCFFLLGSKYRVSNEGFVAGLFVFGVLVELGGPCC